ncbi:SMI1/KNR4 family protein [Thermomonospora umbrina]|uniref:Knr4/Smi1-like domain-containing protein n=1 Tax=Thermomonospora umbrina TaxID=111806 RepID=A0A3D9SRK0_9ACTN|nr:SMI1/KNR4 family protein [Thermomonospora umbrina]REE97120.1 hypothetical protein DFJ69_2576 [Thermomonospora umbrina]
MDLNRFSIEEFHGYIVERGLVRRGDQTGCSDEEIAHLARTQGVQRIPALYRDFLRVMGKSPYPLMTGTTWAYEDLLRIKQSSLELLEDDGADPAILDDALVIAMHQGYVVYYIPGASTASDDPGVWTYVEEEQPTNPWPTFRRFLWSLAEMRGEELGIYKELEATGRFTMTRQPGDEDD